ncbi:MAG: hypothetical protein ACD_75C02551G0003 [uncultured bacterium]|nr:MAG: hypothetical protein ACD_75C02551G0003 [uncultured bacterium]
MKLKTISLQNYRLFSNLTCSLQSDLTVFVASNGGGKTSILDAIKVLFDTYLSVFPTSFGRGIKPADVRQVPIKDELGRMEQVFPVRVAASGEIEEGGGEYVWSRAVNTPKSGTTIKEAKDMAVYGKRLLAGAANREDRTNWPLLAYYGTGRLWSQKKLTSKKQFASGFHTRAAGYIDCMEPASSYKLFLDWFHYAYNAHTQAKIRYMEANPEASSLEVMSVSSAFTPLLNAVREAVDTVLVPSGWKSLWYSDTHGDAIASHDQYGRLAVSQLSDGIRNTIALVADIAFRSVQLNAHLGERAAIETQGIVLIDEVDMHLHPEWQQLILANLRKAFPKIQFIVTTHSPQVLTTVPSECIRILKDGQIFAAPPGTEGAEPTRLLKQVFGLENVRPPGNRATKELIEYLSLVENDQWESPRAQELRRILDARYQGNEPGLDEADLLIENRKWELGE